MSVKFREVIKRGAKHKVFRKTKDAFKQSFGAFQSDKSAEEIISEIRSSRTFTHYKTTRPSEHPAHLGFATAKVVGDIRITAFLIGEDYAQLDYFNFA